MTETAEKGFLEGLDDAKDKIIFGIVIPNNDALIGTVGLHDIKWKDHVATTGAMIGDEENRNRGFGTDAKMTLLDYAFNELNLRKICSSVLSFNERSIGYNLRCGYRIEGVRKQQIFTGGRYWDEVLLAVFREDWVPLWEHY